MSDGYTVGKALFSIADKAKVEQRLEENSVRARTETIDKANLVSGTHGDCFLVSFDDDMDIGEMSDLFEGITCGLAEQYIETKFESYWANPNEEDMSDELGQDVLNLI